MPVTALRPRESALMANMIYGGLQLDDPDQIMAGAVGDLNTRWAPVGDTIKGRSGVGPKFMKRNSNFAMVLQRKGAPTEKAVVIRGTQKTSLRDWLTNGNMGVTPGPGGTVVHMGFNRVFKSILPDVDAAVTGSRTDLLHVVGHSLGGAIATHMATHYALAGRSVALYTYGAPRPGFYDFSRKVRSAVGPNNVYRVYDLRDPVPMVPLFPFFHPNSPSDGIRVGGSTGRISVGAHDMESNYIRQVGESDWTALTREGAGYKSHQGLDYWLEEAGRATRIPGASLGLWALGKALQALLKLVAVSVQFVIGVAATTLDLMAWLLTKAVEMAGKIGSSALRWIGLALRWLGRGAYNAGVTAGQVTRAFLRYVLDLMTRAIFTPINAAINAFT
ncbi:MAG: lipase family protein [Pseudomonadota bacterium]